MGSEGTVWKLRSRLRSVKKKIDLFLDQRLARTLETVDRSAETADRYTSAAKDRAVSVLRTIDRTGGKYFEVVFSRESMYRIFDKMVEHPKTTVMITFIITALLVFPLINWDAVDRKINRGEDPYNVLGYLNMNMNAAFDVYLPKGEEETKILEEVRKDWTVDIVILYFETENRYDPSVKVNITNVTVLKEISAIEKGLNWAPNDHGIQDDFIYVLSIAKMVRELNGSPPRAIRSLRGQVEKVTGIETPTNSMIEDWINSTGADRIPDSQNDVDDFIHQIKKDILQHFVLDTNGDGVWDSTISLLGLVQNLDFDEITMRVRDFYRSHIKAYNRRPDVKEEHMRLRVRDTGTIPVTKDVQDRSTSEGLRALIIATIFVLIALFIFHRTLKIMLISLIPVSISIAITFSIVAITKLPITPQVIVVGPILIALGVAYGLYIANRYAEEEIEDSVERIKVAVRTTGRAVFLSAITTAGGFASLMVSNILPMQTVGLTLTMGIMINYIIAIVLVPSMVLLLDYRKRKDTLGEKFRYISPIPVKHTRKILAFGVVLVIISLGLLWSGAIGSDVDFLDFAPDDQESLKTFKDYAHIFHGGETGMVIVRGLPARGDRYEGSMKDYDVLKSVEFLEDKIKEVPDTWAVSMVDIFKTLRLRNVLDTQDDYGLISYLLSLLAYSPLDVHVEDRLNMSYWELIETSPENKDPYNVRLFWIEMVYDSLTPELREFLVNKDYSKMLIFIDMPIRSVAESRASVNGVNRAVDNYPAGKSTSRLTGVAAVGLAVNDLIFSNAIQSLLLSLVFVLVVLLVIFRSVRYSVITIIPLSMVVALLPLSFYLVNTPITIITAMLGSIVVGAGIDFSIHMTERVREEGETFEGIRTAIETSGRSFMEATIVTLSGLFAGYFIPIQPIHVFILLIQILLLICAFAAMFYLTSIYAYLIRGRLYDELMYGRRTEEAAEPTTF